MKATKTITLFLSFLFLANIAVAQKAKLMRANKDMEYLNYQEAIPSYLEFLEKNDLPEAKINLAECYRKIGNMAEAEYWYSQIVHLPEAKSVHKLYYGQALQSNGKCELAKEWFELYSSEVPEDGRGHLLSRTCDPTEMRILLNSKSKFYEINHLPFNTQYDDFGPTFFRDGLVFTSERDDRGMVKRRSTWTGNPFLEMFYTDIDTLDKEGFEYTYLKEPDKYENKLNTKYHDGPVAFSSDYKTVYITRNNVIGGQTGRDDEGVIRLKIVVADLVGNKWENVRELSFNSDEYSVAHPTVSADGQSLYFSSDMPGGFGGMDLYVASLEGTEWVNPVNLGPSINTEGHEVFPFMHPNQRLFFASDGHVGLGGLDMYFVEKRGQAWSPIMNMGAPLNSKEDDFGVILNDDETFGYFASDRNGGVGRDDIYSFRKTYANLDVLVYDEVTGDPIANANVYDHCSGLSFTTDADGHTRIETGLGECCSFAASKLEYEDNMKEACTKDMKNGETRLVKIPLIMPMEFAIEGTVYNLETMKAVEGAEVKLVSSCGKVAQTVTTAADGRYFFTLDRDCCYKVRADKDNYLASVPDDEFCTMGMKKSYVFNQDLPLQPYVTNPDEEIFASSLTADEAPPKQESISFIIEHIYYDFDKYYIREDAKEPLEELIELMDNNPNLIIEIGSHTDARGSDRYNQYLSRKRAKAVVEYLLSKDIDSERLTYKGYGEEDPVNDCVNEIQCDEEQHQRNRRTEFRVIGTLDGKEFNALSVAPRNIQVDKCDDCPF